MKSDGISTLVNYQILKNSVDQMTLTLLNPIVYQTTVMKLGKLIG